MSSSLDNQTKFYKTWWFWTLVFWPYALIKFGIPKWQTLNKKNKVITVFAFILLLVIGAFIPTSKPITSGSPSTSSSSTSCFEMDKGKALVEIYSYSCDSDQLANLKRNSVDDTYPYCSLQGNIKTRKYRCSP